ncbi:MAG: AtpZ/AtpI family protein [Syntrophomonas sp.]|nr:AtpZ/AtpI family protein [Syntrophomonas sp.]
MTKKKQSWVKPMSNAINLGTSVAAAIGLGLFGGNWLDERLGMGYLFTLLGLLLGIITAGKIMWQHMIGDSQKNSFTDKQKKQDE